MRQFIAGYLTDNQEKNILDIGSMDINGSYRPLFNKDIWHYTGMDVAAGKNVDIVGWDSLPSNWDIVVCGQVLEHVRRPWLVVADIFKLLKPGGLCCCIAPCAIHKHDYPIDCWRFYPEGMRTLFKDANFDILSCTMHPYKYKDQKWGDTMCISQKPS